MIMKIEKYDLEGLSGTAVVSTIVVLTAEKWTHSSMGSTLMVVNLDGQG